jgi:hypothetical protein
MEFGLAEYLGSIDLNNRKVLKHPDGSIGTEFSFGFSPDGTTEVLIPQIVDGKQVTKQDAIKHFFKTGEHLGTWDKATAMKERGLGEQEFYKALDDYANAIHNRQIC